MIPYIVGQLAPNSSHLTRGLVNVSPVGAIFVPFPPKTGIFVFTSPPPLIVERVAGVTVCERGSGVSERARNRVRDLHVVFARFNRALFTGYVGARYKRSTYSFHERSGWRAFLEILCQRDGWFMRV